MDVWDYFLRRQAECDEMSVDGRGLEYYAEEGSGDTRGRLVGHVHFNEDAYLEVHETVEITTDDTPHRVDYAYYLIVRGVEYWGYERDPSHDPAVHRHTANHAERHAAEPISFKDACKLAWRDLSVDVGDENDDA